MGREQRKRMQRNLKTVTHIVNRLRDRCIVKHDVEIYEDGDLMIVDVDLAHFLNDSRQFRAISQVSAQLLLPMYSRWGHNFDSINYFDWEVVREGDKEFSKCFIRFTIFPERFVPFSYCNVCGRRTKRPYGARRGVDKKTICPKCGLVLRVDCTDNIKEYKILPKKQRGVEFKRDERDSNA
jgi:hypothetical protein